MVVGFNHNFRYKGELYHVQTEDSGIRNPQIVTLLYTGGTIIASHKSSYAHLLQSANLERQVEETMKAQHREMLRRLRDGELDEKIRQATRGGAAVAAEPPAATPPPPARTAAPAAVPPPPPAAAAKPQPAPAVPAPPADKRVVEVSLDDLILSYLVGEDQR